MSRFLLSSLVLLLANSFSFSQITLYPKIGTNFSWTTFKLGSADDQTRVNTPASVGIYAALGIDFKISKHISIRPELAYNQFKVSWSLHYSGVPDSTWYEQTGRVRNENRTYLTVPLNFVGNFNHWLITLGPYISLGLNVGRFQETYIESNLKEYSYVTIDGKLKAGTVPSSYGGFGVSDLSYFNPLDVGMNFGIGYQLGKILISSQFCLGFTDTQRHYAGSYFENRRGEFVTRNRGLSITVAYRIQLKKPTAQLKV